MLSTGVCVPHSVSSQEGARLPPAQVMMTNGGQLTPGPGVRHPRVPTATQHPRGPQAGTWCLCVATGRAGLHPIPSLSPELPSLKAKEKVAPALDILIAEARGKFRVSGAPTP